MLFKNMFAIDRSAPEIILSPRLLNPFKSLEFGHVNRGKEWA